MKHFGKLALLGAALAVSATYAHATTVVYSTTGTFGAGTITSGTNGTGTVTDTFGGGGNTLSLAFAGINNATVTAPTNGSIGSFTASVTGTGASASGSFTLGIVQSAPGSGSGSLLGTLSGAFTSNSSTGVINFSQLTMTIAGIVYTLQQPVGGYDLVSPTTNGGVTSIQMNITPTPEPNSLMLLGTGLLSAGGMIMRRRRLTA